MDTPKSINLNILNMSTIHACHCKCTTISIENQHVLEAEMLERTQSESTELDAIGTASANAILHQYILAYPIFLMALKTIGIISRIDIAIANDHIATIYHIQSIIIPISLRIHFDPINQQVAALVVLLIPTGRILKRDAAHSNIGTPVEMNILRTIALIWAIIAEWIVKQAE